MPAKFRKSTAWLLLAKRNLEYIVVDIRYGPVVHGQAGGSKMVKLLRKFRRDQSGATAIEYGLIAALISVVAITALTSTGTNLKTKVEAVSDALK